MHIKFHWDVLKAWNLVCAGTCSPRKTTLRKPHFLDSKKTQTLNETALNLTRQCNTFVLSKGRQSSYTEWSSFQMKPGHWKTKKQNHLLIMCACMIHCTVWLASYDVVTSITVFQAACACACTCVCVSVERRRCLYLNRVILSVKLQSLLLSVEGWSDVLSIINSVRMRICMRVRLCARAASVRMRMCANMRVRSLPDRCQ